MIQNVKFILDWNSRSLQVSYGANYVAVLHIPRLIVVGPYYEDSGMPAFGCVNEIVEVEKIVVVSTQEHLALT